MTSPCPCGDSLCPRCPHGDPLCPCQDGDPCHYEGPNPMTARIYRCCMECGKGDVPVSREAYNCEVCGTLVEKII